MLSMHEVDNYKFQFVDVFPRTDILDMFQRTGKTPDKFRGQRKRQKIAGWACSHENVYLTERMDESLNFELL